MELVRSYKKLSGRFAGFFFRFVILFLVTFEYALADDSIQVQYKFEKTFFLDIARSKDNLISVGERGLVFRSKNLGKSWESIQIKEKPTLTSIVFTNKKTAIAVGHKGGAYKTTNLGKSFTKINISQTKTEDSLLRIRLVDKNHIVIVGAWGLLIESLDNGKTWKKHKIISPEFDWHLYDVIKSSFGLLAVGEAGTLVLRKLNEVNWKKIDSPYQGSYFGIVKGGKNNFYVYGMRGNIFEFDMPKIKTGNFKFVSKSLKTDTRSTWMSGLKLDDNSLLFFGDGGLIGKKTKTFTRKTVPLRVVNSGVELNDGSVFLVGMDGGFILD